jgi:hypothetical protein
MSFAIREFIYGRIEKPVFSQVFWAQAAATVVGGATINLNFRNEKVEYIVSHQIWLSKGAAAGAIIQFSDMFGQPYFQLQAIAAVPFGLFPFTHIFEAGSFIVNANGAIFFSIGYQKVTRSEK